MSYAVEDDFPIPETSNRGRPAKYPFSSMAPGESVFIEGERVGGKAYLGAQAVGRHKGWRFSGRTYESGVRIWRLE